MEFGRLLGADVRRMLDENASTRPARLLLEGIREKKHVDVLRMLHEGTSANIDYHGVLPLMVAVTNGVAAVMRVPRCASAKW